MGKEKKDLEFDGEIALFEGKPFSGFCVEHLDYMGHEDRQGGGKEPSVMQVMKQKLEKMEDVEKSTAIRIYQYQ